MTKSYRFAQKLEPQLSATQDPALSRPLFFKKKKKKNCSAARLKGRCSFFRIRIERSNPAKIYLQYGRVTDRLTSTF